MSAYVVVEATACDPEARDRYGSQIGPVLKQFGGEILAFGPWHCSLASLPVTTA